ncbi:unnamed protein product [Aureobasidium pullulans]|nr:unnamed protein product [Aureobasidium pullulans]
MLIQHVIPICLAGIVAAATQAESPTNESSDIALVKFNTQSHPGLCKTWLNGHGVFRAHISMQMYLGSFERDEARFRTPRCAGCEDNSKGRSKASPQDYRQNFTENDSKDNGADNDQGHSSIDQVYAQGFHQDNAWHLNQENFHGEAVLYLSQAIVEKLLCLELVHSSMCCHLNINSSRLDIHFHEAEICFTTHHDQVKYKSCHFGEQVDNACEFCPHFGRIDLVNSFIEHIFYAPRHQAQSHLHFAAQRQRNFPTVHLWH